MGEKFGSEREVRAVLHNIKEQRLLEKSLGTLDLEESYAVKLLNLDYKGVKIKQHRLRNKVNKVKSYLTPDEIADLKTRGIDEQIARAERNKPHSAGATRIAAAAKRLKLGVTPRETRWGVRPATAIGTTSSRDVINGGNDATRPETSTSGPRQKLRPATSVGVAPRSFGGKSRSDPPPPPRPKTAPGEVISTPIITGAPRLQRDSAAAGRRSRKMSSYSTSSLGDEQRAAAALERRRDLLGEIAAEQEEARTKCEAFMEKADYWVRSNPSVSYDRSRDEEGDRPGSRLFKSAGEEKLEHGRLARQDSRLSAVDQEAAWRELKKCRYLRIDDDDVDLSGVSTLATDQVKMMQSFKQTRISPLVTTFDL